MDEIYWPSPDITDMKCEICKNIKWTDLNKEEDVYFATCECGHSQELIK